MTEYLKIYRERVPAWIGRISQWAEQVYFICDVIEVDEHRRLCEEAGAKCVSSIKEVVLPVEPILFIESESQWQSPPCPQNGKKIFAIGARACDIAALNLLDRVFGEGCPDELYISRRKRILIVGMLCLTKGEGCFCEFFGINRVGTETMDAVVIMVGKEVFVRGITDAGRGFIEKCRDIFKEADDRQCQWVDNLIEEARRQAQFEIEKVKSMAEAIVSARIFSDGTITDAFLQELAHRCIGCGCCWHVCPACWCFDIRDIAPTVYEGMRGSYPATHGREKCTCLEAVRVRIAEGCTSPGYGRVAGGADPLSTPLDRIKHRFFHKFVTIPLQMAVAGCTGCGRCTKACPNSIGGGEIIMKLKRNGFMR